MLRAALAQGKQLGRAVLSPVPMGQILSYSHVQELGDRDLEIILLNIYEGGTCRGRER